MVLRIVWLVCYILVLLLIVVLSLTACALVFKRGLAIQRDLTVSSQLI